MALNTMYAAQANSPTTTLTAAIGAADTTILVTSAAVLPSAVPFELSLGIGEAAAETVLVTAVSGNSLTVTRGWDGTAQAWPVNTVVARTFSARDLNDLQANITALKNDLDGLVDNTLDVSGKAADAAAVGSALYRTKSRTANKPAAYTFWDISADFSSSSPASPSDMPVNSYTYTTGDILAGFNNDLFTLGSSAPYIVWCWANLHSTSASVTRYYIVLRTSSKTVYLGRSTNSGSTVSWADMSAVTPDTGLTESGVPADAATVGTALYRSKVRANNIPAAMTCWKVNTLFSSASPAAPADMPIDSFAYSTGDVLAGFTNNLFTVSGSTGWWVYCFGNIETSSAAVRVYVMIRPATGAVYIGRSTNSGSTVSWKATSSDARPTASIMFVGDSITRGRLGGQSANAATPIPDRVAAELGVNCQNFGIGDIGWCAGYSTGTTYGYAKDNALAYLKRVGNSNYYSASTPYNGYKFMGTGGWADFNAVVIALGANDASFALGDVADLPTYDAMSYADVMAWNMGHGGSDKTILKAMYQVYRYIRESETQYNNGVYTYVNENTYVVDAAELTTPVYVAGGSKLPIIICDPLVSSGAGSAPLWTYPVTRAGGYTKTQMCELYAAFAQRYGLGHISCFDAPIDRVNPSNSLPDGLHPNEDTYAMLGRFFAGKISALVI